MNDEEFIEKFHTTFIQLDTKMQVYRGGIWNSWAQLPNHTKDSWRRINTHKDAILNAKTAEELYTHYEGAISAPNPIPWPTLTSKYHQFWEAFLLEIKNWNTTNTIVPIEELKAYKLKSSGRKFTVIDGNDGWITIKFFDNGDTVLIKNKDLETEALAL